MAILVQVPDGLSKKNAAAHTANYHAGPYVIPERGGQFDPLVAL
jgi:hypothetical protein